MLIAPLESPAALALRAWLRAAAAGADEAGCCGRAAEAVAGDPWRVVEVAGPLARARMVVAAQDLALDEGLRPRRVDHPRAVARVPSGAPYPALDLAGRRSAGAFDTPRDMARRVVAAGLAACRRPVGEALDPSCGTGAFLAALAERGVGGIRGEDLDPRALAVCRVAVPTARLREADGLEPGPSADLVVGNPPFVPPERQGRELRRQLGERFPWLRGRFDLAVPFAWMAAERARTGGGLGLVLPASLGVQPYGRVLRVAWLRAHRVAHLGHPEPFPGATVAVVVVALEVGGGPAPVAPAGVDPDELLALPNVPLAALHRPGDGAIVARIRAASVPLGDLAEVDTGVVCHGPGHRRADLLSAEPGPGRVPFVEARDLQEGRRCWLDYAPARMHRAKRPSLFAPPKLLVQRVGGASRVRAWVDRDEGLFAGHTLTVVRPTDARVPLERLRDLLQDPLVRGLLRVEQGPRLDLYPHDVAGVPVPRAWLEDPEVEPGEAWGLAPRERARLVEAAG